jgi:hypothetical protein
MGDMGGRGMGDMEGGGGVKSKRGIMRSCDHKEIFLLTTLNLGLLVLVLSVKCPSSLHYSKLKFA